MCFDGEVQEWFLVGLGVRNEAGKAGIYLEVLIYFDVRVF